MIGTCNQKVCCAILHQACDGFLGKGEDVGRKDPHVESPDHCQDQSEDRSR
jgi:hypothetical protein